MCDAVGNDGGGERNEGIELWTPELGKWLADVRLDGASLSPPSPLSDGDKQCLSELLKGLKVTGIEPEQILVVCEAGSKLYNLALPTSDSDYIIIFQHPTNAILSSLNSLKVSLL